MSTHRAELENFYDGPIPAAALTCARLGGPNAVALLRAAGETAGFKSMVLGQIKIIRERRADGSYLPYMLDDLAYYRREFVRWRRQVRTLRALVMGESAAEPVLVATSGYLNLPLRSLAEVRRLHGVAAE